MSTTRPVHLLDQPDPLGRPRKAVWRQVRRLLVDRVESLAQTRPYELGRICLVASDADLGRALAHDLATRVTHIDPSEAATAKDRESGAHVVCLVLPVGLSGPARVRLLASAYGRLRAGGRLVMVATVVVARSQAPPRPPSMSQLTRELHQATGMAMHLVDMESLRWANEPFTRGVCLTITRLGGDWTGE